MFYIIYARLFIVMIAANLCRFLFFNGFYYSECCVPVSLLCYGPISHLIDCLPREKKTEISKF